uniref:Serine-threonine/tyrosine-protein kinase catalytic domain-containing protein n=1 Tax=Rhizophagus irregularis (strain DAOM 181602 / DAOM 197198 / MUCL 43194) TaxID=747089 RepID=U9U5F9_RHIID
MKSCWNPDPKKRPPIKEICLTIYNWSDKGKNKEEFKPFIQALSALISKCLSTNSSSTISFGNNQDYDYNYISKENELDISLPQNITIQNSSTSLKKRNTEDEIQDDSAGKRIKTS